MGTGYVRQDVTNSISNGEIVDAADLNAEFDAIEDALSITGHTHDGTSAEGGPIEVIGPAQDFVATASLFRPKTDNTYDLGSATYEFKDIYIDGVGYLDAVDIDGGTIDATIIGGTTAAAGTFTSLTANSLTASANITAGGSVSATGDIQGANIYTPGGPGNRVLLSGSNITAVSGTIDSFTSTSVNIDGGNIDGTVIGATTPRGGTFTTIKSTSTTPVLNLNESDTTNGLSIYQSAGIFYNAFVDSSGVATTNFLVATRANTYEIQDWSIRIPGAGTANEEVLKLNSAGVISLRAASNTTASAANLFINSANGLLQRSTSSGEYKINRLPLEDASEVIDGLEPLSFESTHEGDAGRRFVGFIAEDVASVVPEASVDDGQNYDVRAIVAYLTQEIKNLRVRIAELENSIG